jgi:hypothetical protein
MFASAKSERTLLLAGSRGQRFGAAISVAPIGDTLGASFVWQDCSHLSKTRVAGFRRLYNRRQKRSRGGSAKQTITHGIGRTFACRYLS